MMKSIRILAILTMASFLLIVPLLAACGDDDGTPSPAVSPTIEPSETPTPIQTIEKKPTLSPVKPATLFRASSSTSRVARREDAPLP